MGLDTSHDCFHGAYSTFNRWRTEIARAAGLPPLPLMEGFFRASEPLHDPFWRSATEDEESASARLAKSLLPIKWDCLKPSPLHTLLNHSDCEGEIERDDCGPIADELERVLPNVAEIWQPHTRQFIAGLRYAAANHESVEFH